VAVALQEIVVTRHQRTGSEDHPLMTTSHHVVEGMGLLLVAGSTTSTSAIAASG
jgi:hypothetical protein